MKTKIQNIRLEVATKKALDNLKAHPRETYEEIIKKIILAGEEKIKRGDEL